MAHVFLTASYHVIVLTLWLTTAVAWARAVYCLVKQTEADDPEARRWRRGYYKAMATFLVCCLVGALLLWIRHEVQKVPLPFN